MVILGASEKLVSIKKKKTHKIRVGNQDLHRPQRTHFSFFGSLLIKLTSKKEILGKKQSLF